MSATSDYSVEFNFREEGTGASTLDSSLSSIQKLLESIDRTVSKGGLTQMLEQADIKAQHLAATVQQITDSTFKSSHMDLKFVVSDEAAQRAVTESLLATNASTIARNEAQQARAEMDSFRRELQDHVTAISSLTNIHQMYGDVAYGAAKKVTGSFAEVQDQLQAVRRTTLELTDSAEKMNAELLDTARNIAIGTDEIASIAEIGGAANVAASEIKDFTESVAAFSTSTESSANNAALSLSKIFNLTRKTAPDATYANLANSIFVDGNNSAATSDQILNMTTRLAPLAAQFNVSADSIIGMSSALASMGIGAERGGTSMIRSFGQISRILGEGGEKLKLLSDISGMSAEQFATAWQSKPIEALTALMEGMQKAEYGGVQFSSTMRRLGVNGTRDGQVWMALSNNIGFFREQLELAGVTIQDEAQLMDLLYQRQHTVEAQMQILTNTAQALSYTMLKGLGSETIIAALQAVSGALAGINKLMDENPAMRLVATLTVGFLGVTGVVSKLVATFLTYRAAVAQIALSNMMLANSERKALIGDQMRTRGILQKVKALWQQVAATKAAAQATGSLNAAEMGGMGGGKLSLGKFAKGGGAVVAAMAALEGLNIIMQSFEDSLKTTEQWYEEAGNAASNFSAAVARDNNVTADAVVQGVKLSASLQQEAADMENLAVASTTAKDAIVNLGTNGFAALEQAINDMKIGKSIEKSITGFFTQESDSMGEFLSGKLSQGIKSADITSVIKSIFEDTRDADKTIQAVKSLSAAYEDAIRALRLFDEDEHRQSLAGAYKSQLGSRADEYIADMQKYEDASGYMKPETLKAFRDAGIDIAEVLLQDRYELSYFSQAWVGAEENTAAYIATLQGMSEVSPYVQEMVNRLEELNSALAAEKGLYDFVDELYDYDEKLSDSGNATKDFVSMLDYLKASSDAGEAFYGIAAAMQALGDAGITSGEQVSYLNDNVLSLLDAELGLNGMLATANIDTSAAQSNIFNLIDAIRQYLQAKVAAGIAANGYWGTTSSGDYGIVLKDNGDDAEARLKAFREGEAAQEALAKMDSYEAKAREAQTAATNAGTRALNDNSKAAGNNAAAQKEAARTILDYANDIEKVIKTMNDLHFGVLDAQLEIAKVYEDIAIKSAKWALGLRDVENLTSDIMKSLYGRQNAADSIADKFNEIEKSISDAKDKYEELMSDLSEQRATEAQLRYWLGIAEAAGDVAEQQRIIAKLQQNAQSQKKTSADMTSTTSTINFTTTGDTEAARKARKDMQDLLAQYLNYIATLAETGASERQIAAAIARSEAQMTAQAKQLGLTADETGELTKAFKANVIVVSKNASQQAELNDLMKRAVTAEQNYIIEIIKHNTNQKDVNKAIADGTARLGEAARQLQSNIDKANYYQIALTGVKTIIDSMPRNITINIWANTSDASAALAEFYSKETARAGSAGRSLGSAMGSGIAAGMAAAMANAKIPLPSLEDQLKAKIRALQSTGEVSVKAMADLRARTFGGLGMTESGGYAGNASTSDIAGFYHGKEYMLNAQATRFYGVPFLNAMNQGKMLPAATAGFSGDVNLSKESLYAFGKIILRGINDQSITLTNNNVLQGQGRLGMTKSVGRPR